MISKKTINQFYDAGKDLVLLHKGTKKPVKDEWTLIQQTREEVLNHKGNLGLRIGDKDIIVDNDPRNGGNESLEKLQQDLGIEIKPTVYTPRGGFHSYMSLPPEYEGKELRKKLKTYSGIDFLTKGAQCLIAGCRTEDGEYIWADDESQFTQTVCPDALLALLVREDTSDEVMFDDVGSSGRVWSKSEVQTLLDKLDPSMDYDSWLRVGMALKNWDAKEGLRLWKEWSKGCEELYKDGESDYKWKGFEVNGGITLGTLVRMSREADYGNEQLLVAEYLRKIRACNDEKTLEFDVTEEIKKLNFSKSNFEKLVKAFQEQEKKICGVRLTLPTIRESLAPNRSRAEIMRSSEAPAWCNDWVYVNDISKFVDMKTLKPFSSKSFNKACGYLVPATDGGFKVSATKFVSDWGYVENASKMAYLPRINDRFCYMGKLRYLNIFNPESMPEAAKEFTEEGLAAIARIERHIVIICNTSENAAFFTQWLAHQVQNPGVLLRWAPFVQSIQGIGKSTFAKLLRGVLGDENIGVVMPTQVMDRFNGWALGRIVNVLEELRMVGHNRHTAANMLKPLITDDMIQINDKGISPFTTYNTANYICFSNFKNALPLEPHDRRWWIIFCTILSLDELSEIVGEPVEDYFNKLHAAIENHHKEIRKWLLEYPITDEFKKTRIAPMTEEKRIMIQMEEQNMSGFPEAQDAISKGDTYYDENVVSSSHLFSDLALYYDIPRIQTRQKNDILCKLGYQQTRKPVKIDDRVLRIWTKKPMTNAEIRAYFQRKKEEEKDDGGF